MSTAEEYLKSMLELSSQASLPSLSSVLSAPSQSSLPSLQLDRGCKVESGFDERCTSDGRGADNDVQAAIHKLESDVLYWQDKVFLMMRTGLVRRRAYGPTTFEDRARARR